jgi:CYTH domain-containing protein
MRIEAVDPFSMPTEIERKFLVSGEAGAIWRRAACDCAMA